MTSERLFIAIPISQALREALRTLQADLCTMLDQEGFEYRKERLENAHITLRFLGETDEAVIPAIEQALTSAPIAARALEVKLSQLGVFSGTRKARVLWVGLDPAKELRRLKQQIDSVLERTGAPEEEERPYTPHLTLVRFKYPQDLRCWQRLEGMQTPAVAERVEQIALYKSELSSQGATHVKRVSRSLEAV